MDLMFGIPVALSSLGRRCNRAQGAAHLGMSESCMASFSWTYLLWALTLGTLSAMSSKASPGFIRRSMYKCWIPAARKSTTPLTSQSGGT